jgi:hypothetical protein
LFSYVPQVREGISVNEDETKKLRIKRGLGFALAAILVVIVILWVAPSVGIREGGKISLSRMQLLYGLVSTVIAVAIYIWGVGKWSRFEPPKNSAVSLSPKASNPAQTPATRSGQPVQPNAGAPAQTAGTPAAPKGGS